MISFVLFICAVIFAVIFTAIRKRSFTKTLLYAVVFFNIGLMGLLAFYAHIFMADSTAEKIGWATGSPFQFEMGIANLSYGVLGILSLWYRGKFTLATILGYSVLLLGAFVGHLIQYSKGDIAPYNIGMFVWFNDLFIPILLNTLLILNWKMKRSGIW